MKKDQVYAVVDIESTGGSIGTGERMIQFACVLVKNSEIIEKFDTFVNPRKKVPKRIQELTDIKPKMVQKAPFFEEIAELIHDLLQDTIFVAHNVAFDYRFLNEEFENVGLSPLTIPAIDTVELSQILFPRADSFNLQELAEWLGYDLNQPHNALFDAEATAFILRKLKQRVKTLPLVTLEKLVKLSPYCIADTHLFFDQAMEEMKQDPADLPKNLFVVNGLAFKDPSTSQQVDSYRTKKVYPETKIDKTWFFDDQLMIRQDQEKMMDAVYDYFTKQDPDHQLAIEAAPGSGKSLGYLVPASFIGQPSEPIVVSTYTTLLQEQLVEETIPTLKKIVPFDFSVALVKSLSHYVSLTKFAQKLSQTTADNLEALFCMRIIVWLTETDTGDLEELSAGSHKSHLFWSEIRYSSESILKEDEWSNIEFYKRIRKEIREASLIITNHAFLAQDWKKENSMLPEFNYLIVDEAHHLPRVLQEVSTETIRSYTLKNLIKELGNQSNDGNVLHYLVSLISSGIVKKYQLDSLESNLQLLEEEWNEFIEHCFSQLDISDEMNSSVREWKEKQFSIEDLTIVEKKTLKRVNTLIDEVLYVGHRIVEVSLKKEEQLSKQDQFIMDHFYHILQDFSDWKTTLSELFAIHDGLKINWMSYFSSQPTKTIRFHSNQAHMNQKVKDSLHTNSHVVYTSSTLSVNDTIRFYQKQIGNEQIDFLSLPSPYDYEEQMQVYLPEDAPQFTNMTKKHYTKWLVDSIEKISSQLDENILVLFRSTKVLQEVYRALASKNDMEHEILAQHLTGTRTKLLKQFKKSDKAILLGADSFWEGIDLPGEELRVVILTRLPFDSPELPLVKMRHHQLENAGQNPFIMDLLPKAVMKLKQGFGRLIRSQEDKGVMILLDDRILTASYSKVFQKSIPNGVTIENIELKEIGSKTQLFLEE